METHSVPMRDPSGAVGSVLSITRDVTDRKRASEEREKLETKLQQAQKLEAIGTLAGGIAHDFNNLLGTILGNLEQALAASREGRPVEENLKEGLLASHRAKRLVRQILAFSRQEPIDRKVLSLERLVAEAIGFLRATIPATVRIESMIEPEVPPVLADPTQIQQILMNLCTNSWQAMSGGPGQIRIGLESRRLDGIEASKIDGLPPGRYVCLTVEDDGQGMDSTTLERIFEPFFTTKGVGQGTGLGLSVVHGIVRHHAGGVTVVSRPGRGTTFRVYLPAAESESVVPTAPVRVMIGGGEHVLCLDDEESLGRVMSRTLQRLGYKVTCFHSPEAALEEFRRAPDAFDLVITDYEMPGMTGLAVAGQILGLRPQARVMLLSGYVKEEILREAARVGIRRVLLKPCETPILSQAVAELLAAEPGARTPSLPASR